MHNNQHARPILDTLRDQRDGELLEDMTDEFNRLIGMIRLTGKKGEINLKLIIEPIKGDADMVTLSDDITVKMPKVKKANTMFYTTEEANLQKRNPRQPDLYDLKEAEVEDSTPIEVNNNKETVEVK